METFAEIEKGGQPAPPKNETRYRIYIKLFGRLEAIDSLGCSILPRTRRGRAVLGILALAAPKSVDRRFLAGLLWTGRHHDQARASLRKCLHELKAAMRGVGDNFIDADRHSVMLHTEDIWVDATIAQTASITTIDHLNLTRKPLMQDLLSINPALNCWIKDEHKRIEQIIKASAESWLATPVDHAETIAPPEKLLCVDSADKGAWQALMLAHSSNREKATAGGAYYRCKVTRPTEVGVLSSHETEVLPTRVRQMDADTYGDVLLASAGKHRPMGRYSTISLGLASIRALNLGAREVAEIFTAELNVALFRFRDISCRTFTFLQGGQSMNSQLAVGIDCLIDGTVYTERKFHTITIRVLDCRIGGEVIWSERFQYDQSDPGSLETIPNTIAAQAHAAVIANESHRLLAGHSSDLTAHQMVLRAVPSVYRLEKRSFFKAGEHLSGAVAQDRDYAAACAWLAYWNLLLVGQGWAQDTNAAATRAAELTQRAILLNPQDAYALTLTGHVLAFIHRRLDDGLALHERALRINPGLALAWFFSGLAHTYAGLHTEGARRIQHAKWLNPFDPHSFFFDMGLSLSHMLRGDVELAVFAGRAASNANPAFSSTFKARLAALGFADESPERAIVLEHLRRLEPGLTVGAALLRSPLARLEDRQRFTEGLHRAGLPD